MTEEVNKKKNPHIAITHNEIQKGSANKRNVSLLMKSDVEIDEDTAALIEKVTGVKVDITKASYETTREKLREAVKKFEMRDYDWSWIVDFDEEHVVFSNDNGMFYTTYTVDGLNVQVGSEAKEVSRVINYVEDEGTVVLSESSEDINSGVLSLIVKSFDSISKNEKLVDVFKSKKGNQMVEIQKAVDEATAVLKADLTSAQTLLKEAQDTIASFEKTAQEQKEKQRQEAVAEVITDVEKATAFLKSVEALEDDAFDTVVQTLKAKNEVVENSDLFEKSSEASPVEKANEEPLHRQKLKEKYGTK